MTPFNQIVRLPEFERDMKSLTKRFRTLPEDLEVLIATPIRLFHKLDVDTGGILRIAGLGETIAPVYKVTRFACRSLKGRGVKSGLRLIYVYFAEQDRIELVEIYFKGDRENEDRERIVARYGSR